MMEGHSEADRGLNRRRKQVAVEDQTSSYLKKSKQNGSVNEESSYFQLLSSIPQNYVLKYVANSLSDQDPENSEADLSDIPFPEEYTPHSEELFTPAGSSDEEDSDWEGEKKILNSSTPRGDDEENGVCDNLQENSSSRGRDETKKKTIFSIVQPMTDSIESDTKQPVNSNLIRDRIMDSIDALENDKPQPEESQTPKSVPPKCIVKLNQETLVFERSPKSGALFATIEIVNDSDTMYLAYQTLFSDAVHSNVSMSNRPMGSVPPGKSSKLRIVIPQANLTDNIFKDIEIMLKLARKENNSSQQNLKDFFQYLQSNCPELICTKLYKGASLLENSDSSDEVVEDNSAPTSPNLCTEEPITKFPGKSIFRGATILDMIAQNWHTLGGILITVLIVACTIKYVPASVEPDNELVNEVSPFIYYYR